MRFLSLILLFPLLTAAATEDLSTMDWNAAIETAVVYNPRFPESEELARHYITQRGIREDRLVALPCSKEETITRAEFDSTIRQPLMQQFVDRGWWRMEEHEVKDHTTGRMHRAYAATGQLVRIVVLMRGMPLRISRTQEQAPAAREDEASVDSELAAMGLGSPVTAGALPNPYFNKRIRFPEDKSAEGMLLVARLDAPNSATVRRIIDDSIAAEAHGLLGRAVVDLAQRSGGYKEGEEWLNRCIQVYRRAGIPTYVDRRPELIPEQWPLPDTALYFGWYNAEVQGPFKAGGFQFVPGAVACHLHSFSARTLRDGGQAWAAPLLEHGAAATLGNVWEPYLSYTTHFHLLNERLLAGFTLAEAVWSATPGISWMNVVVGDPLYRPFAQRTLPAEDMKDYALFQGLVEKHRNDTSPAPLKRAVVDLAERKSAPRLLELLALLAAVDGSPNEAANLLQHARTLYTQPADRLRTILIEADCLRHGSQPLQRDLAERLLRESLANASLQSEAAYRLIETLLPAKTSATN